MKNLIAGLFLICASLPAFALDIVSLYCADGQDTTTLTMALIASVDPTTVPSGLEVDGLLLYIPVLALSNARCAEIKAMDPNDLRYLQFEMQRK